MNGTIAHEGAWLPNRLVVAGSLGAVLLAGCSAAPAAAAGGFAPSPDPVLAAAAAKAGVFAPFLGSFRGELRMFTGPGEQRVPMGLDVLPTEDPAVWTWTLRYGSGEREQVRDYRLCLDDVAAGRCRVDERNGIELPGRVVDGELVTVFAVPEQTLVVRYRVVALGIEFALEAWNPEQDGRTGSDVRTSGAVSCQRAMLRAVGR